MKKVSYRTTSEHGLTPDGKLPPEKLLAWIDEHIVEANERIDASAHNGSSNDVEEGKAQILKKLKEELFGKVYNT